MKIVIDIPENYYNDLKSLKLSDGEHLSYEMEMLRNGTPLPKRHGRLIDADKMTSELLTIDSNYAYMADWCLQIIDAQPIIIEADKEAGKHEEI